MAQSQVNIRMDSRKLEVLEAAAYVDGQTVPEFLRAAIEALVTELLDQVPVQLAIQARDARAREARGNVAGFPTKHRPEQTANG